MCVRRSQKISEERDEREEERQTRAKIREKFLDFSRLREKSKTSLKKKNIYRGALLSSSLREHTYTREREKTFFRDLAYKNTHARTHERDRDRDTEGEFLKARKKRIHHPRTKREREREDLFLHGQVFREWKSI